MESREEQEVIIRVHQLKKKYGDLAAVNGISFDIFRGEIFGLLGPNGAGKTTIIRMLCGLLTPTSGEIMLHGQSNLTRGEISSRIGLCPQENIHWEKLSCREQLLFMGSMYDMETSRLRTVADRLLHMLGLTDKAGVLASRLSGGMKRRLNIALSLVHDPDILILDEPEAGLDPQSRVLVREFIKSMSREKTIILTTHNMDEADRLSNRVGIIDRGEILVIDTPGQLKKSLGQGDVLEIELTNPETEALREIQESLSVCCEHVNIFNHTVLVKSKDLIRKIPEISGKIDAVKAGVQKMIMRENTLEDVFIQLTGRKLRQ